MVVLAVAGGRTAAAAGKAPVVVELFTSQGCSSCPPADKILGELSTRKDVIALTLPVDYWDYLGWKDTLASPGNTQRQRAYAANLAGNRVYTPQMIFNGQVQTVGSVRSRVDEALKLAHDKSAGRRVPVTMKSNAEYVTVTAGGGGDLSASGSATMWLVLTSRKETVNIRRGENSGRKIAYHNVVRQMVPIGTWSGEEVSMKLPRRDLMIDAYDGCTIMLQKGKAGPIIGAAHLASDQMTN